MTPTRLLALVVPLLCLAAPFAGLPGLAGVTPGAAWLGFGTVLLIVGLWHYADEMAYGNVGGEEMV